MRGEMKHNKEKEKGRGEGWEGGGVREEEDSPFLAVS